MSDLVKREPSTAPMVYEQGQNIWVDDYLREKEGDFHKYYEIVLKRKWLIVSVVLAALAVTVIWNSTVTPKYRSSVKIQIDPEESVLPYKEIYESVTASPRYLETQAQVLKSETLVRRIVQRLNLGADPGVIGWFTSSLQVSPIVNTQVVAVSYISEDPKFAATAVNALAEEYIEYSFESKREATTRARDFLEKELLKLKQKLERSEEELAQYARNHNIFLTAEKDNVILQKFGDLNQEMTKVEAQLLSNQHEAIRDSTPENFPESLKTNSMRDLERRRASLEEKLTDLSLRFGPRWPEVITLREEVADVKRQLANETRRAYEQTKLEYDLVQAHRRRVAAALAGQNRLVDQLGQDSIQFNTLKREVETDRQLHDGLLQRLKETDVSAGLKSANIHVIDRGGVPPAPYSPNVPRNLALGLVLGLMAGVTLAFFCEFVDRTIKTPEDVEQALGLPSLAVIPAFQKSWKEATAGLLVQGTAEAQHSTLVPYVDATARVYWESYRALRTSLLLSSRDGRPQSILVTSAVPGEGKSTTAVNLGIAFAQTGARTLVLELDMRKPRLADLFHVGKNRGLSRHLSGQSDLNTEIQQTGIPNLFVVAAGPIPPNPAELIGSARMDVAVQLLARHFQHIIIDGPPLMSVTDALVISPQVDGVLLVVQGAKTPKAVVEKARDLLRSVDAKILGVLVNAMDMKHSQYGYYQGYYASAEDN